MAIVREEIAAGGLDATTISAAVAFQSQTTSAFAGAPATDQIATTSAEIRCCFMELLTIVSPLMAASPARALRDLLAMVDVAVDRAARRGSNGLTATATMS